MATACLNQSRFAATLLLCWAAIVPALCTGCVDTELGLDATVEQSSIRVSGVEGAEVINLSADVFYRVGEHAPDAHRFVPNAFELYVDSELVVSLTPERPAAFVEELSPGQSARLTFEARSEPGMAALARSLCGADVRVLLRWTDAFDRSLGMTSTDTSDVTCD